MSDNRNAEAFLKHISDLGPIGQFAAKTLIVAVVAVASLSILLFQLDNVLSTRIGQLTQEIRSATKVNGHVVWLKLEQDLEKAADPANDLPPERKVKLLAAIRTLSDRWGPFLAEASAGLSSGSSRASTEDKK